MSATQKIDTTLAASLVRVAVGMGTIKDAKLLASACGIDWGQIDAFVDKGTRPSRPVH